MKKLIQRILVCSLSFACLSTGLSAENKKLKIFILAGQSNMQGHCTTSVIENRLKDPKLKMGFEKYHQDESFVKRDDVCIFRMSEYEFSINGGGDVQNAGVF